MTVSPYGVPHSLQGAGLVLAADAGGVSACLGGTQVGPDAQQGGSQEHSPQEVSV